MNGRFVCDIDVYTLQPFFLSYCNEWKTKSYFLLCPPIVQRNNNPIDLNSHQNPQKIINTFKLNIFLSISKRTVSPSLWSNRVLDACAILPCEDKWAGRHARASEFSEEPASWVGTPNSLPFPGRSHELPTCIREVFSVKWLKYSVMKTMYIMSLVAAGGEWEGV